MIEFILIGFIFGYGLSSILLSRKRFVVKTNEGGETTIEPLNRPKHKMEFLPEIDQKELEEIERPSKLQEFMGGFKKSAKEDDEEEI